MYNYSGEKLEKLLNDYHSLKIDLSIAEGRKNLYEKTGDKSIFDDVKNHLDESSEFEVIPHMHDLRKEVKKAYNL